MAGLLLVCTPGLVWAPTLLRSTAGALELWTSVVAIDLGILVAIAFLLNATPSGLQATSWSVALASITTVGLAVGGLRASRNSVHPDEVLSPRVPHARPSLRQTLAIGIGAAALVGAALVSIVSDHSAKSEHFTEVSLVPCPPVRHPTSAVLLLTNREGVTVDYRIGYTTGGTSSRRAVTLQDGWSFRRRVSVLGGAASVTVYRGSHAFRHVWIGNADGTARPGFAPSASPDRDTTASPTC
jgi:hypothetical protein